MRSINFAKADRASDQPMISRAGLAPVARFQSINEMSHTVLPRAV